MPRRSRPPSPAITLIGLLIAVVAQAAPASLPLDPQWRLLGPFRGGWGEMVEGVTTQPDTFYFGAAGVKPSR